ncbi:MAG TPA: polysaccharide biosynthesis tyrosine autokinase, partial [Myxococcota bacterium]|nr:polysaccharide biosynthesis tyrosine autokinase [Myxococcota bacterium]
VRRRQALVLLVALPLLIPATVLPFMLKHYYEATATVAIQAAPKALDFGGDVLPGVISSARNPQAIESTMVTLMYSDTVLGPVIDQLPSDSLFRPSLLDYVKARLNGESGARVPSSQQEREMRLGVLRGQIDVQLAGGGSFLQIQARGGSPDSASWIANGVADAFVRYLQMQRDDGSKRAVTWLNRQVYELRDQIATKESAAAELVSKNQVPASATSQGEDSDSLASIDTSFQAARIDLYAARQRLAELAPRAASSGTGTKSRALRQLREDYQAALRALEAARLRFTPTHPEVRRLEGMIKDLSARLGAAGASDAPPLSATEETEYQRVRGEAARLEMKVQSLEQARGDMIGDGGVRSEALSRYKRLRAELEIDKQLLSVLLTRRNESLLTAADKQSGAYVLDYAVAPLWPAGPSRRKYLALGWVAALAAGISIGFLRELLDRRMRDPEGIARALGVQTIGLIPQVEDKTALPEHQSGRARRGPAAEGYRNLRTSILFKTREIKLHSLLITSAIAGEGKTTTSLNLASAFAQMGRRVILIDADMRRGRIDRVFNLPRSPGLAEVLDGKARFEECAQHPDGVEFEVLTAGSLPENPSELLASNAYAALMSMLRSEYDVAILDSPVLLAVPDALLLAADADATLLVHRPGSVELRALKRMREDLERAGARVLGVAFNWVDASDRAAYPSYLESPYLEQQAKKRRARGDRT